jgi:hypothetical protein
MAGWRASLVSTLRSLVPKKEEILGRSSDGETWAVFDGIVKFSLGILRWPELPWSGIWCLSDTEIGLPGFLLLCSLLPRLQTSAQDIHENAPRVFRCTLSETGGRF